MSKLIKLTTRNTKTMAHVAVNETIHINVDAIAYVRSWSGATFIGVIGTTEVFHVAESVDEVIAAMGRVKS